MMEATGRMEVTVGALFRRSFRRACRSLGLEYTEDKGWLDSQFIVSGRAKDVLALREACRELSEGRQ